MPEVNKPTTKTTSRDLFPGALEMMILESLRRQPSHGYALVQQIQRRSKHLLQVEEGSLYPALQISSFERKFEDIALVLNASEATTN